MPMHLVQELNVGTVGFEYFSITFCQYFTIKLLLSGGGWIMRQAVVGVFG